MAMVSKHLPCGKNSPPWELVRSEWCVWECGVHGGVDSLNGVGEWYRQISDDIMKIIYDDIIFITSAG